MFLYEYVQNVLSLSFLLKVVKFIGIAVVGYITLLFANRRIYHLLKKRTSSHAALIIKKSLYYFGIALLILTLLHELGFNLTALLGAAGVAGVAIGFASRTSMSNVISGVFLLFERTFSVDDFISFDSISGTVEEVDLFSIKLRTLENTLVRVPNELLLTKPITNFSHYNKRRLSCTITTSYQTNIKELVALVRHVTEEQELVLKQPKPEIRIDEFFDDRCSLRMRVWVKNSDVLHAQEQLLAHIRQKLEQQDVHVSELYLGFKVPNSNVVHVRTNK